MGDKELARNGEDENGDEDEGGDGHGISVEMVEVGSLVRSRTSAGAFRWAVGLLSGEQGVRAAVRALIQCGRAGAASDSGDKS